MAVFPLCHSCFTCA